jgi:hypothetical protein
MYKHKVTSILLEEDGYLEKSKDAYSKYGVACLQDKKSYAGSDNYTKYGYDMHKIYPSVMDFPAYWCDSFVDWGFYKAYGVANAKGLLGGNFDDYTKGSINLYKSKNAFFLRGEKTPEEGDQVFFSKDGTFKGVHHTAYVYAVENGKVLTVEGNTTNSSEVVQNGGGVWKKSYSLSDTRIYGYGRPPYSKYENVETETSSSVSSYKKGTVIEATEYVSKTGSMKLTDTKLTVEIDLAVRSTPDYGVRPYWFKTKDGYISAYRVSGWVHDENGWWYEQYGHEYTKNCVKTINGEEYHFDKNGYMLTSDRIDSSGKILY